MCYVKWETDCISFEEFVAQFNDPGAHVSIYLGPVCLRSGFEHRSLMAYCATLNYHSAQIQYPCVSYKETEVLNWGCAYIFWFSK